jgi:hypothetical protein
MHDQEEKRMSGNLLPLSPLILLTQKKAGLVFVKTPTLQGGSMWLITDLRRYDERSA